MARDLIGFKIREIRKSKGMTQVDLARSVGISASYLNLIEANKRSIAGGLLNRIAQALDMDLDRLTGTAEQRLIDDLNEVAATPLLRDLQLDPRQRQQLVGLAPSWARALLALFRAYRENAQTVTALSDRLNRDPMLADLVHQMLSQVTAMRSMSEILDSVDDLGANQRRRFLAAMNQESARLSDVATSLASFFEVSPHATPTLTAAEEVDDLIVENGNHFPALETAAAALRSEVEKHGETIDSALMEFLDRRFGISIQRQSPVTADMARFRNQCAFDEASRCFTFLDHTAIPTLRFQLARLAIQKSLAPVLTDLLSGSSLSDSARDQAFRALGSYGAGALLFPYDRFAEDTRAARYDIEILRQRYGASFEQLCHRLITLRRPGDEAIPFAFMRTNPAGFTSKRFPIPGLPLPRHGHACPLWAIYGAFQTPGRVVRQYATFPDQARFLFIARTVTKRPPTFHAPQFLYSVMIAFDPIYADQTVYGDGLDLSTTAMADPVGSNCALCPRLGCQQREQEAIRGIDSTSSRTHASRRS